jgi:hypothetical protein
MEKVNGYTLFILRYQFNGMSVYLSTSIRLSKLLNVFLLMSLYESIMCYPFTYTIFNPRIMITEVKMGMVLLQSQKNTVQVTQSSLKFNTVLFVLTVLLFHLVELGILALCNHAHLAEHETSKIQDSIEHFLARGNDAVFW